MGIYAYVPTYDVLNLNDVICMYVFRADDLLFDNQLLSFPLVQPFLPLSLFLSCLQFSVQGEVSQGCPLHISMSTLAIIQLVFRQSC